MGTRRQRGSQYEYDCSTFVNEDFSVVLLAADDGWIAVSVDSFRYAVAVLDVACRRLGLGWLLWSAAEQGNQERCWHQALDAVSFIVSRSMYWLQ